VIGSHEDAIKRRFLEVYHITRPLAPPYSLHTVLLKVESYNDTHIPSWRSAPPPAVHRPV
jgi:hypothetical protein